MTEMEVGSHWWQRWRRVEIGGTERWVVCNTERRARKGRGENWPDRITIIRAVWYPVVMVCKGTGTFIKLLWNVEELKKKIVILHVKLHESFTWCYPCGYSWLIEWTFLNSSPWRKKNSGFWIGVWMMWFGRKKKRMQQNEKKNKENVRNALAKSHWSDFLHQRLPKGGSIHINQSLLGLCRAVGRFFSFAITYLFYGQEKIIPVINFIFLLFFLPLKKHRFFLLFFLIRLLPLELVELNKERKKRHLSPAH